MIVVIPQETTTHLQTTLRLQLQQNQQQKGVVDPAEEKARERERKGKVKNSNSSAAVCIVIISVCLLSRAVEESRRQNEYHQVQMVVSHLLQSTQVTVFVVSTNLV